MTTYDLGDADLAPQSMVRRSFVDENNVTHAVLVVRLEADFYGLGDVCSHADVSLRDGTLWPDECEVECPKHGSLFSLQTGEPQTLPATQPVPVYNVVVDGSKLLVILP